MTYPRILVSCLVLPAIVLAGCSELGSNAAVVGDAAIPSSEVQATVERCRQTENFKQLAPQQGGGQQLAHQFEQGFLSQLIRLEVLRAEADRLSIDVSSQEVQARIDEFRGQFENEQQFRQQVKEQCLTFQQLEDLVMTQIAEQRIRRRVTEGVAPTTEELRALYEERIAEFTNTEVQHILVERRALAQRIARQLQAAPARTVEDRFAALAKRFTTDRQNRNDAGNLGVVGPGQLDPAFDETMNRLSIGEVSDPVKTRFGWHVIRVIDRRTQPFSMVRDQLISETSGDRVEEAFQEWLADAYERADVRIDPRYGELDEETQRVVDPTAEDLPATEEQEESPSPEPPPRGQ